MTPRKQTGFFLHDFVAYMHISQFTLLLWSFFRSSNGLPGSIWPGAYLIIQKLSETEKMLTSIVNILFLIYSYIYIIY